MNKRIVISVIVAIGLIALIIVKLMANKEKAKEKIYIHDTKAAVTVETLRPIMHSFENSLTYLGTFEPFRQNTIGSDASGKIVALNVEEGDRVSKGQLIAKVDDELLQLQLEQVEVQLEGQKNDDKRYDNLSKDNAIAGVTVEKTKLGLKSTELQKKQIQKQLRSTNLKAPFSGVVTKRMIDLGSVVGPGAQLIEITDISSLKLTVSVPERDILKFKNGQQVQTTADVYGNKVFVGKVTNVSVVGDRAHNYKVEITVNNAKQDLRAGMYGSVRLTNSKSITALAIPRKALIGSSKSPRVYVVRNGIAELVSFTAGTSDGDYVEVVSGLKKTDQIVIKGQVNLQDKNAVKILK